MTASLVLLLAALVGIAAALEYRRRLSFTESDGEKRRQQLQQQTLELSRKLKEADGELARKRELAEQLPLIIGNLAQELPENSLPPLAVRFAKNFFYARQVGYFVPIEGTSDYTLEVGVGFSTDWQGKVRIASDEGILGMAIQRKVVVAKCDPSSSCGRRSLRLSLEQSGVEPDFVAPVIGLSGIAGLLVIAGCPFPHEQERVNVSMLADLLSGALQKAALAELSKSSTWVDPLTGVANRLYFARRFESEVRRAQNYQQTLALLMLDIDGFKTVNDRFGHPAGDLAIRKFAEIIRTITRSSDLVCRYGGDEFAVLLASSNVEQARAYADHLVEKLAATEIPVPRHATPIHLTTSGGLAMYPGDGRSTTELLHAADDALYEAKRQGRNRVILARSPAPDGDVVLAEGREGEESAPAESDTAKEAGAGR